MWVSRRTDSRICDALSRRNVRTLALSDVRVSCEGVKAASLASAGIAEAKGLDQIVSALGKDGRFGLAVRPMDTSAGAFSELQRLRYVPGLSAVVLDPELAVYGAGTASSLGSREREALSYVARAILGGASEPSVTSFPASLRRVERVEVMVSLVERGEPRLWRSARGTSLARALLTATRVARDRWRERETAMGGPLRERLLDLDVEVSLLEEDGTFTSATPTFVDRAVSEAHGIGFDYRSDWHYLLPKDVHRRSDGSAFKALSKLAEERGLSPAVLSSAATRLYRFVPVLLSSSRARGSAIDTGPSAGGVSD